MTHDLRSVLDDLYAIDPALKEQEEQLMPLIETLLHAKPNITPDAVFVERLRMLLKERALEPASMSLLERLVSFFAIPRLAFGMGGVVAGVLLGVVILPILQPDVPLREKSAQMESAVPPSLAIGRGGGGDAAISTMPMIAPDGPVPPFFSTYAFTVDGALPPLPQGTVDVFKRERNTLSADTARILQNLHVDLLDLATFKENSIDSINFIQDVPYGFTINLALREGMLSLYQNREQWPHPEENCKDEACFRKFQNTPDAVPSDDEVITIADAFVRDHSIDLTSYGPPQIDSSWRRQYDAMPVSDQTTFSVGDVVRVIYPFTMKNTPVVDASGAPIGITVGVNIREKKVQEATGIMNRTYRSSAYRTASEGEVRKMLTASDAENAPSISLGTPTLGYTTVSVFADNRMEELLVPALIFPVTQVPEGAYFYQSSVIVPLAKDLPGLDTARGGVAPVGR